MEVMSFVKERKELVAAIEKISNSKMKYQGPPTFSYVGAGVRVQKDGTITIEDLETSRPLLRELVSQKLIDDSWDMERAVLTISFPLDSHTGHSLFNLISIFYTKAEILNKAIGVPKAFEVRESFLELLMKELPDTTEEFIARWEENESEQVTRGIDFRDNKITFTGFPITKDGDFVKAFTELSAAINKLSLEAKRIQLKKEPIENEKYAFRIWLVRIGLDGEAHKTSRKILLQNLSGHTAFRTKEQQEQHKQRYEMKKAKEVADDEKSKVRN